MIFVFSLSFCHILTYPRSRNCVGGVPSCRLGSRLDCRVGDRYSLYPGC